MITLAEAREIAYSWHGGGGSPLYSFASTSGHRTPKNITPETIAEVQNNLDWCSTMPKKNVSNSTKTLEDLRAYLVANLPDQSEEE